MKIFLLTTDISLTANHWKPIATVRDSADAMLQLT